MISPVTLKPNAEPIEEFSSKQIVELYQSSLNLDVANYFQGVDKLVLCRCNDTLYRFFHPAIAGDEAFYAQLQKSGSYYRDWNLENEVALSHLGSNHALLEIGCGNGSFLERVQSRCASVSAIEFNPKLIALLGEKGIPIWNQSIQDHARTHAEHYDIICAFQVLEHVPEVNSFINAALSCLKKGGKLIFSVPNNNPYLFKYEKYHVLNLPPHHVGLWDKAALMNLSKVFNLEVLAIKVEPLWAIKHQLSVIGQHRHNKALMRFADLIPGLAERIMGCTLSRFFDGRNLVVVYRKC
jgi:2-polyprenyl-3-methyl-5-hydroxy-6-metoxy-1,4-benzoquinol methylase